MIALYTARSKSLAGGCTIKDLESLAATDYRAGAIYADPPWRFETWSAAGKDRPAERHYNTQDSFDISQLPVADLAVDNCALFLWATKTPWGFNYKTIAFTWVKRNKSGVGFPMALGHWTRSNPEICLFGTKGKPRRLAKGVRELVVAPRARHSEKPEEARNRIERLVAGPYLELCGRKSAPNWRVWGDEVPAKGFGL